MSLDSNIKKYKIYINWINRINFITPQFSMTLGLSRNSLVWQSQGLSKHDLFFTVQWIIFLNTQFPGKNLSGLGLVQFHHKILLARNNMTVEHIPQLPTVPKFSRCRVYQTFSFLGSISQISQNPTPIDLAFKSRLGLQYPLLKN